MRVISGKYKGKKLEGFQIEGTRPTMDRVKESMFGMIQNYIKNSVVLDLFAGSGGLGIEALSNGASKCVFVDKNDIAIKSIKNNTSGIDNIEIIKNDSLEYLKKTNLKFDLIFLDPPYFEDLMNNCLKLIKDKELLKENGIIVCEAEVPFECDFVLVKEKKYGSKSVFIYK